MKEQQKHANPQKHVIFSQPSTSNLQKHSGTKWYRYQIYKSLYKAHRSCIMHVQPAKAYIKVIQSIYAHIEKLIGLVAAIFCSFGRKSAPWKPFETIWGRNCSYTPSGVSWTYKDPQMSRTYYLLETKQICKLLDITILIILPRSSIPVVWRLITAVICFYVESTMIPCLRSRSGKSFT